LKIIYMGTPQFAIPPLEAILAAGHEVLAVVTQADKPKGRDQKLAGSPVKEAAIQQGIAVLQPPRIKAAEAIAEMRAYHADIYVVAAYGQLLSEEILAIPPLGCLNIHASLLPRFRGAAPIERAIIAGERETGITIMQMDKGLDTGDILLAANIPIADQDTGGTLREKLSILGASLVTEALTKIENGSIIKTKQDDAAATYAPPLKREEGRLDWGMSATALERRVRGFNPWPGTYTRYQSKTLKVWSADCEEWPGAKKQKPGTIIDIKKDRLVVACGEDGLALKELQLEGKKRMAVKDFLLGKRFTVGEMFHS
jgi:methionyl-tRNA formyltransferase